MYRFISSRVRNKADYSSGIFFHCTQWISTGAEAVLWEVLGKRSRCCLAHCMQSICSAEDGLE